VIATPAAPAAIRKVDWGLYHVIRILSPFLSNLRELWRAVGPDRLFFTAAEAVGPPFYFHLS
jgi:hypothetical protein